MPEEAIAAGSVEEAIEKIIPYLEDTEDTAYKAIYFDGWDGLAASAVLRSVAEHPPPSLRKNFDKIIHVDCSRWKSRRALQRAIADELKLGQEVMAVFDRHDEEDDLSGVDEGSRDVIINVTRVILGSLLQYRFLLIFHNGSNDVVDLFSCGIPPGTVVLCTFRGRLHLQPELIKNVPSSVLFLCVRARLFRDWFCGFSWNDYLQEEARESALYMKKLGFGITDETINECFLYLLSLNHRGGDIVDYNWETHASSYWVCDGIVEGGQDNQAWEVARALHKELRLEDFSSNTTPYFVEYMDTPPDRWIIHTNSNMNNKALPGTTSLFLACRERFDRSLMSLPTDMFHQADQLRVLKLCCCSFSFESPPFHCCRNLRFLGLDSCMNQQQGGEEERKDSPAVEIFQRLWVLDLCYTDWQFGCPPEAKDHVATNIREIHINKGRIWRSIFVSMQLQSLQKLCITEPTSYWETCKKDDFTDMVKLEPLDSAESNSIHLLPNLSGATSIKILVLAGCVGLEHVGPEGLPPSLESFSLDGGSGEDNKEAKISRITLAGCAKLKDFRLQGPLPNLEELDLSGTAVRMLDLRKEVHAPKLKRIFLIGCRKLVSIAWPVGGMQQLRLLCIDTREEAVCKISHDSLVARNQEQEKNCHAFVAVVDMRFLQSLVLPSNHDRFFWATASFKLNICLSSTSSKNDENSDKKKVGPSQLVWSPMHASLISKTSCIYNDINNEQKPTIIDGRSEVQLQPLDCHVEIGEGISGIDTQNDKGLHAIIHVMGSVQSLHVHDNSSNNTFIPKLVATPRWGLLFNRLKWCRVQRCSKLEVVFTTNYQWYQFYELDTFWAADLLMARSIWSKGRASKQDVSFGKLRAIYLHSCPRLIFVLPLYMNNTLPSLETLHIVYCGDLKEIFPVVPEFLNEVANRHRNGMLEFPKLKDLYLHDLSCLQQICEAKIFAPKLETIYLRGCWGLRRLPATDSHRLQDGCPVVVDCEKDYWDNLEWDGINVGHHPSLFKLHHSAYYKKRLLRRTVLR